MTEIIIPDVVVIYLYILPDTNFLAPHWRHWLGTSMLGT